jgi:hypothetical protein
MCFFCRILNETMKRNWMRRKGKNSLVLFVCRRVCLRDGWKICECVWSRQKTIPESLLQFTDAYTQFSAIIPHTKCLQWVKGRAVHIARRFFFLPQKLFMKKISFGMLSGFALLCMTLELKHLKQFHINQNFCATENVLEQSRKLWLEKGFEKDLFTVKLQVYID